MASAAARQKWRTVVTSPATPEEVVKRGEIYRVCPDGRWEFYFDNTLIRTFHDCEAKFKLRHVDRLALKGPELEKGRIYFGAAATVGIWWSKCMENFYNKMRDWQEGKRPILKREDILTSAGAAWVECEMEKWATIDPKGYETFKGIPGSMQMAGRYFDMLAQHDLFNWRIVAAELGFGRLREVFVGENERVRVYLIGRPDLVVISKSDNRLMPIDHKTRHRIQGKYHSQFKPHNQTAGYIYSTGIIARELGMDYEVDRCVINLAARMEPSEKPRDGKPKPRFARAFPHYSPQEIEEWRDRMVESATRLRHCYETNTWPWREQSCHLYNGCEYRRIHSVPPGARPAAMNADFVQIEPWVSYDLEEDEDNGY